MEDAVETVAEWVGSTLDPTTALRIRHTAERLHMGVLKARADVYIDTNFEAVTKTEEWQMLPAEAVEEVLARDELRPGGGCAMGPAAEGRGCFRQRLGVAIYITHSITYSHLLKLHLLLSSA